MASGKYLGCLALALTFALGARMAGKLLQDFDSPEAMLSAFLTALEARQLPRVLPQAGGCRLWIWGEPEYPRRLREIYDPPTLLYVSGNVELLGRSLISILGARRPTTEGNQMARKLGRDLVDRAW